MCIFIGTLGRTGKKTMKGYNKNCKQTAGLPVFVKANKLSRYLP